MASKRKSESDAQPGAQPTSATVTAGIQKFQTYVAQLRGDEKGEAQLYLDRLFQAFGHGGTIEAGAVPEDRLPKKDKGMRFLDLHWPGRVLFEMKKRGEKLEKHYDQALQYWMRLTPNRPRYVVLCNFDELWVYDMEIQVDDPMDKVALLDLSSRWGPLRFLLPVPEPPLFDNNVEQVARGAADAMAEVFRKAVERGEDRERAQRFVLQCVIAMYAEDVDLLPRSIFTQLCQDAADGNGSAYDLFGGLFQQMNNPKVASGGRYRGVPYFNGGLFSVVEPVELTKQDTKSVLDAARKNWALVHPAIFGALFSESMGKEKRHAFGAHFTSEADIVKVIEPTIIRPWRERIRTANTLKDLRSVRTAMGDYRVLDPACGSGNFLYVAYRAMKRLERQVLAKVTERFSKKEATRLEGSVISLSQFHGIDVLPFAVELAKVTMVLAKEAQLLERRKELGQNALQFEQPLPLDNLDDNFICADALFCDWPKVDVIVGNPPFLDARKITQEWGREYNNRLRDRYPEIPGRADLCAYFFRRAHDHIPIYDKETHVSGRVGLVGTNSIRQNYSRIAALDHVVKTGGTIVEAVSSQVWPGEAAVNVSIVNWVKGPVSGPRVLHEQMGDRRNSPWRREEVPQISSALSSSTDVSPAANIAVVISPKVCFEGQQPGHKGFRLNDTEYRDLRKRVADIDAICFRYINGSDLVSGRHREMPEYIIDFGGMNILAASKHEAALKIVEMRVLPDWTRNANEERKKTGKETGEHQNRLNHWWQLKRRRATMIESIGRLKRYVVCVRHTKRPIFVFLSSHIHPDSALTVFAFEDDYSFGILQSDIHWRWFMARCSSLKRDPRYTNETVFDTFPWPQAPSRANVKAVAGAAVSLRRLRKEAMIGLKGGLRALYRILEKPGASPLKDAHARLDDAVVDAFGFSAKQDELSQLLALNADIATNSQAFGPGPPSSFADPTILVSDDCI